METKDDAVAMDYKDIERFIAKNNMQDVTLVPIYRNLSDKEHTLEEQFMISACTHLKNEIKKFVKNEKYKKNGDHFSKDKCFRFIYKDPDNEDNHAYCFIFGCSGGKPYIITQKTIKDTRVLATMWNDADIKWTLFGNPFLWNSIKDEMSCGYTGLTMLKDLKAEHIKNIVQDKQNSQILDKDKHQIISYKTIIPASKDVIPDSMMYVSQNATGIEKYRKDIYNVLDKFKHIQNTNGVKYNAYAQKKIEEIKSWK